MRSRTWNPVLPGSFSLMRIEAESKTDHCLDPVSLCVRVDAGVREAGSVATSPRRLRVQVRVPADALRDANTSAR